MVANPKKVNEMAQNLKQMRMAVPLADCDCRVLLKLGRRNMIPDNFLDFDCALELIE